MVPAIVVIIRDSCIVVIIRDSRIVIIIRDSRIVVISGSRNSSNYSWLPQ